MIWLNLSLDTVYTIHELRVTYYLKKCERLYSENYMNRKLIYFAY